MNNLKGDESACFNPQQQLLICDDCKRNLSHLKIKNHRVWSDFKVEVIDTSKMAPGSPKVVCNGYWKKER